MRGEIDMSEDFEVVVRRALAALGVADEVTLIHAGGSNGSAGDALTAELRVNAAGAKSVSISVNTTDDDARLESETRAELRRALRMCPLCQRIGHVEKLRGAEGPQEGCVVRCPACGEYEIDQELVRRFRSAWERNDRTVLERLPSLSARTRGGSHVRITTESWRGESGRGEGS
jgi:hypothetical protein